MKHRRPRCLLLGVGAALFLHLTSGSACAQIAPAVPQIPVPVKQPAARYWTSRWSFDDVDIQTVFTRMKSMGVEIPFKATGNVSVDFDVSVPWNRLRDGKAYRFGGQLKAQRLQLEHMLLEDLEAEVRYVDGVLKLVDVKGRWTDLAETETRGSFRGKAEAELLPRGKFRTDIVAESLPLSPLQQMLLANSEQPTRSMRGTVSGRIEFNAPIEQLSDPKHWSLDADLQVENFRLGGALALAAQTGPVQIRDGVFRAEQIRISSPSSADVLLALGLQVELAGQQRFNFQVRANDIPLEDVTEMVFDDPAIATGKLDLNLRGRGELSTESWDIAGQIGSPGLTVLGQDLGLVEHDFQFDRRRFEFAAIDPKAGEQSDRILIKRIVADYVLDENSLQINDISARVFDGIVEGQATFARKDGAQHRLQANWRDLDLHLNATPFVPGRLKVAASTSGSIEWSFGRGALGTPAAHQGTVDARLEQVTIGGADVGDLDISMHAAESAVQLAGDGKLFGGQVRVDTSSEIEPEDSWWTILERPVGNAQGKQMKLASIAHALKLDRRARWDGTVSLNLQQPTLALSSSSAAKTPLLAISVQDAAIDGHSISRRVDLLLRMKGDTIVVEQLSGNYAGGNVWLEGRWSLRHGPRRIHCRLARIDAGLALLPVLPAAAQRVDGKVSGKITLTGDESLRVGGSITARDSALFSIPTGTVHAGVRGSMPLDFSHWKLTLHSIRAEMADGRISADAHLASSHNHRRGFDLSSRWDIRRVNFGKLLAATGSKSRFANGNMTGSLTLGGRGIRDSRDLVGRFDARLGSTQAAAVPGLMEANQFLGLISLNGVRFKNGGMKGIISSGSASLDEFWLSSGTVKVWSEGKVQLANQRMDLDVVISTGYLQSDQGQLLSLASQLAIQSVIPVAALVEVNRILNYRTLHLAFDGPLNDPRIRLKPMEIIREEAARFLLRELLIAGSVSGDVL